MGNEIGFVWRVQDPDSWRKMYERLVAYKKEYRTTCVPRQWKEDPKLGRWVQIQRRQCKDQDRINLLNKIAFVWQIKDPNSWRKMYERLVAYKKEYGTTCVPRQWKEDPKLANWVKKQRCKCKDQDRIDLLNNINFVWQVRDQNSW